MLSQVPSSGWVYQSRWWEYLISGYIVPEGMYNPLPPPTPNMGPEISTHSWYWHLVAATTARTVWQAQDQVRIILDHAVRRLFVYPWVSNFLCLSILVLKYELDKKNFERWKQVFSLCDVLVYPPCRSVFTFTFRDQPLYADGYDSRPGMRTERNQSVIELTGLNCQCDLSH